MTAKMMHLAMWYAGHEPAVAANAALRLGSGWNGGDFVTTYAAHRVAWYLAPVEQHR